MREAQCSACNEVYNPEFCFFEPHLEDALQALTTGNPHGALPARLVGKLDAISSTEEGQR